MTDIDCQRCGACCCNTADNRRTGYQLYVEIDDEHRGLLERDDLRKRYVVEHPKDGPHLRLEPNGRCSALKGQLGARVSCQVYVHRPAACRRVEAGSEECLRARKDAGLA